MNILQSIANADNIISNICLNKSDLIVDIKLWNETKRQLKFINYYVFKGKQSIEDERGDIIIQNNSVLLDELKQDMVNSDGTVDEIKDVQSIKFYNEE